MPDLIVPTLDISDLSVYYGHKCAVENVSFNAHSGHIYAIIGNNGCGKTSLMKAVMNLTGHNGICRLNGKVLCENILDENVTDAVIADNFSERPSEQKIAEITSVVTDFMERGSEEFKVGGSMDIITSVERIWENGGKYYALCSRSIGGVEVNDNKVFCTVEGGEVISASGTWCFLTIGDSYSAQLCDIINILFNVKKELGASENEVTIKAIEKCYSLYTYGENEDFCLIPCMKVVTDNAGELIYNAIDGTIYTKK